MEVNGESPNNRDASEALKPNTAISEQTATVNSMPEGSDDDTEIAKR